MTPRLWLVVEALTVTLAAAVTYKLGGDQALAASRALYAIGGTHELCMGSDLGTTFTEGLDGFRQPRAGGRSTSIVLSCWTTTG